MLPKPTGCVGCPMYGDGLGFVPDSIPSEPVVLFLGQNPGADEEVGRKVVGSDSSGKAVYEPHPPAPFIGKTGWFWETKLLPQAGLRREDVAICNVLRCRQIVNGKRTNDMPTGEVLKQAVAHCTQAHLRIPDTVKLIITGGQHGWDLAGGFGDVTEWRGYTLPGGFTVRRLEPATSGAELLRYASLPNVITSGPVAGTGAPGEGVGTEFTVPVLCTLHPAFLLRDASMDIPTRRDWAKVPAILAGKYPQPLPGAFAVEYKSHEDRMLAWFEKARQAEYVAIDTEYTPDKLIWLIGLGFPGMPYGLQFRWLHADLPSWMRAVFVQQFTELIASVPVVMFNAIADVTAIRKTWGLDWSDYKFIHDPMQAHACLWSEWPHDLNFVASVYSPYEPTKHLMDTDPMKYNWGDVCHTMAVWEVLQAELNHDPGVARIYQEHNLAMLPGIDVAMTTGLAVNAEKVERRIAQYEGRLREATAIGQAYCGWPINLGSPQQLKHILYDIEGLPVQKHPKSKKPTIESDAVSELRKRYIAPDPAEKPTIASMLANIEAGGHPLLESAYGYAKSEHALSSYLYPLVVNGDS